MGRKKNYQPLSVFLNARLVGQLRRQASGAIHFGYHSGWLSWEHSLPVSLSLPLREDRYTGAQVTAFFENLLPDYAPIRKRVAERVGAEGIDAFSLLSHIGRDCVGALQFLPDGEAPQTTKALSGRVLSEQDISQLLGSLDVTPLGIRSDNDFRISVAGAQEKTALLFHQGNWIEPDGTTATTHIIKPQIGKSGNGLDLSDSVENEFVCLRLMQQFGFATANVEIAQFNDTKALVIERFDRRWTSDGRLIRLPQEDCCQALSVPPSQKYQSESGPGVIDIMKLLRGSDEPTQDRSQFFKANILFWLMGATDGHAKNFSLALLSNGQFHMTPLYDVLTVQPYFDQKQLTHKDFKLAMSVGSSNKYNVERIRGRHFVETGLQSGLSRVAISNLIDEVICNVDTALQETVKSLPADIPTALMDSIIAAFDRRVPWLKEQ